MTAPARTARLDILVEGYARSPHVAGTVSLVRDADRFLGLVEESLGLTRHEALPTVLGRVG